MEATLNYTKKFDNSNLEVLVGYSFQSFQNYGRTVIGFGFENSGLGQIADDLENGAGIVQGAIGNTPYQQYGFSDAGLFLNQVLPKVNAGVELDAPSGVPVASLAGNLYDNTDELRNLLRSHKLQTSRQIFIYLYA